MISAQKLVCLAAFWKFRQLMNLICPILHYDINSITLVGSALVMSVCGLYSLAELRRLPFKTDKQHVIYKCKNSNNNKSNSSHHASKSWHHQGHLIFNILS